MFGLTQFKMHKSQIQTKGSGWPLTSICADNRVKTAFLCGECRTIYRFVVLFCFIRQRNRCQHCKNVIFTRMTQARPPYVCTATRSSDLLQESLLSLLGVLTVPKKTLALCQLRQVHSFESLDMHRISLWFSPWSLREKASFNSPHIGDGTQ